VLEQSPAAKKGVAAVGSLVVLTSGANSDFYFIGPAAGGTEVLFEGREILIITPSSPLGTKLMGRRVGESVAVQPGRPPLRIRSLS
jgi:transcription elongation GreA/GreB family factor